MGKKVILILADGMKGQSVIDCKNAFANKLLEKYTHKLDTQTVMPSVTLPCHMSLFHSVPPQRHGVLTNTYTPQVRPVKSLVNLLAEQKKVCGMFYNWEELRDLSRPGALLKSLFTENDLEGKGDEELTQEAIRFAKERKADFIFLYFGSPDCVGHTLGFESEKYLQSISHSFDCIEQVYNALKEEYTILITADHGGHERSHGCDIKEDMEIPLIIIDGEQKKTLPQDTTIMDIAPTITALMGISSDSDWEGKNVL